MKETLEIKDLDFLANLMLVFFHAGEICIRATEDYFKDRYRASQEYQQLRKKYGKAQADMIVGDEVKRLLRHNEKYQYGKIIKHVEQLKSMMSEVTAISIGSVESEKGTDRRGDVQCV